MLKVYRVYNCVSVDGADWREVGQGGYKISDEEDETKFILENASFDEVREYLSQYRLDGVWNDATLFRGKPQVAVDYDGAWDDVRYRKFDTMSYKQVYKEWHGVPLRWLMDHASAEQAIQYLKDRGITVCPIINTK